MTRGQAVQRKARGEPTSEAVSSSQQVAAAGLAGSPQTLPHLEAIQSLFGHHDVSNINAYVGGPAADAASELGAEAYAIGDSVAFETSPDLHTAAHEAAHVVQQRSGVHLKGGIGAAGDAYERHADRVADLVVAGKSAEAELSTLSGQSGGMAVQMKEKDKNKASTGKKKEQTGNKEQTGKKKKRKSRKEKQKEKVELSTYVALLRGIDKVLSGRVTMADNYLEQGIETADQLRTAFNVSALNYVAASQQHERIVNIASERAKDTEAIIDLFVGIGIGVGVGLLSAAVLPEAAWWGIEALYNLGGELVELGVGTVAGLGIDAAIADLPGNPLGGTSRHHEQLVELYRGLAVTGRDAVSAAIVSKAVTRLIGESKLLIAGADAELSVEQVREAVTKIQKVPHFIPYPAGSLKSLKSELAGYQGGPDARELEQFIWVAWIADLGYYEDELGEWIYGNTDAVDNNTISTYLEDDINVLGPGSILGVDFGLVTQESDERKAVRAANAKWNEMYDRMSRFVGRD